MCCAEVLNCACLQAAFYDGWIILNSGNTTDKETKDMQLESSFKEEIQREKEEEVKSTKEGNSDLSSNDGSDLIFLLVNGMSLFLKCAYYYEIFVSFTKVDDDVFFNLIFVSS